MTRTQKFGHYCFLFCAQFLLSTPPGIAMGKASPICYCGPFTAEKTTLMKKDRDDAAKFASDPDFHRPDIASA